MFSLINIHLLHGYMEQLCCTLTLTLKVAKSFETYLSNFTNSSFPVQCRQGEFLNTTDSGRSICQKCPVNTFWVMRLNAENVMTGAGCEKCFDWLESPEGSLDISYCVCNNEQCGEFTFLYNVRFLYYQSLDPL